VGSRDLPTTTISAERATASGANQFSIFVQKKFELRSKHTTNRNFRRFGKGLPRGFAARHSGFTPFYNFSMFPVDSFAVLYYSDSRINYK
jgi:hypothetical protein